MSNALAVIDERELIDRISDGAFLRDLAKETGIDKRRLSERLRKHPDYPAAKETSIECQLDDAQLAISLAKETADIARAREMFRAAAWRAEREFPERWGQKANGPVVIDLGNALQLLSERIQQRNGQDSQPAIDSVATVVSPEQHDAAQQVG